MSVFLAPIINDQQVDNNGNPLSGGTIEVYLAGTSTPSTTYSDKNGLVPNTTPIVLNTLGVNNQGEIWLTGGASYKFIIKNSVGIVQRTLDNVSGINDSAISTDQWVVFQGVPTFVSTTSFTLVGDQTQIFQIGRRLKTTNTGGTIFSTITNSVYGAPNTTVTVANDSGVLDSGLAAVSYGVISPQDTSLPVPYPPMRNLLVNGNFAVNQRAYATGVATTAVNQVTLDRWRIVTSGQSLTFGAAAPDRVVTAPAGGMEQIIEAGWVFGGLYVLSWTGTATATVNGVAVVNGSRTASLPANTAITIRFTGGTVGLAQFEPTYITPFERRPPGLELFLCQREYQKSYADATAPGTSTASGRYFLAGNVANSITGTLPLRASMRIAPTVTLWDNNGVIASTISLAAGGGTTSRAAASANITTNSFEINSAVGTDVQISGQWAAATGT